MLDGNDHFFACVPWFARYAYEVLVLPRRPMTSLVDLDDDGCRVARAPCCATSSAATTRCGASACPTCSRSTRPRSATIPHYPFHVELHPPLRAPGLMKYLAGPEIGGGSMTNESDPDEKAAELRGALP